MDIGYCRMPCCRVISPRAEGTKPTAFRDNGIIQLDGLAINKNNGKRTLIDDVRDVVSRFATQEFNVVHVHTVLEQRGVEITGKSPRARISVALADLTEQKFIERTFQGKGNVPNRYRLLKADELT